MSTVGIVGKLQSTQITHSTHSTHNTQKILPKKAPQPISCQKGHNLAPIKRKSGWDILCVFPIRSLD